MACEEEGGEGASKQGGGTPALRDRDAELWRAMCWCGGPALVGQWGQSDECGNSEYNICGTWGDIPSRWSCRGVGGVVVGGGGDA